MATITPDDLIWIPDAAECFVPGRAVDAFKPGTAAKVKTDDGKILKLTAKESVACCARDVQSEGILENMVLFNDLNEPAILHNLRKRFATDDIYTSVGSILVAVNPFKLLPVYTPKILDSYLDTSAEKPPPHVWQIARAAYQDLLDHKLSQAILISGESGAGKTESMKLMLQYLAEASSRQTIAEAVAEPAEPAGAGGGGGSGDGPQGGAGISADTKRRMSFTDTGTGAAAAGEGGSSALQSQSSSSSDSLEQMILLTNPITEAFGNAKTLRNNNSSRFGKWTALSFGPSGRVQGAYIVNYLLEKSRVVRPPEGERNYHIFYELLAACESDCDGRPELAGLQLQSDPALYPFLTRGGCTTVDDFDDRAEFSVLYEAMLHIGLGGAEQIYEVLCVLAAVLHLSKAQFVVEQHATTEDSAALDATAQAEMDAASRLLQVDGVELSRALLSHNIGTRSVIFVPYSAPQAEAARDGLAKALYSALFDWLIGRMNESLARTEQAAAGARDEDAEAVLQREPLSIGVLDIFGFETFQTNSFEQLCINFCNERLQFFFNNYIFTLEAAEYEAEGIAVAKVGFKNNGPCVALLAAKSTGLFSLCDEELLVPGGSDAALLSKLFRMHASVAPPHPNLARPKVTAKDATVSFVINHYAGPVTYNTVGFLEKNKDQLMTDLQDVIRQSDNPFVVQLFAVDDAEVAAFQKGNAIGGGGGGRGLKSGGGGRSSAAEAEADDFAKGGGADGPPSPGGERQRKKSNLQQLGMYAGRKASTGPARKGSASAQGGGRLGGRSRVARDADGAGSGGGRIGAGGVARRARGRTRATTLGASRIKVRGERGEGRGESFLHAGRLAHQGERGEGRGESFHHAGRLAHQGPAPRLHRSCTASSCTVPAPFPHRSNTLTSCHATSL
jgi:myosin heavy subunit